jgi:hypothetical protein
LPEDKIKEEKKKKKRNLLLYRAFFQQQMKLNSKRKDRKCKEQVA